MFRSGFVRIHALLVVGCHAPPPNSSPREDIAVKGSRCSSSGGVIDCQFIKKHAHYFDRLSTDDKLLKEYLQVDWAKTYDPADAADFFAYDNWDEVSRWGADEIASVAF